MQPLKIHLPLKYMQGPRNMIMSLLLLLNCMLHLYCWHLVLESLTWEGINIQLYVEHIPFWPETFLQFFLLYKPN